MTSLPTAHLVAPQTSLSLVQIMGQIHSSLEAQLSVIMPVFPLMIILTYLAMIILTHLAMTIPALLVMIILITLALTWPHTLPHPPMHQVMFPQQ